MNADDIMTYIIRERPLTDDELTIAPDGYTFKGGYVAILTWHEFANPWSDRENVRRFRSLDAARRFIGKLYGDADDVDWDIVDMLTA